MLLLDHERLDFYRVGLDFVSFADELVANLPRGRAYLIDQLQRAATSIAANIAEGAGEFSRRDKARFYRMALRSATECAALLDVIRRTKLADDVAVAPGRELLVRLVQMLTKVVKNLGEPSGTGMGHGSGNGSGNGNGNERDHDE
jgi:four helix bundle protein